jgi:hypothetical protein
MIKYNPHVLCGYLTGVLQFNFDLEFWKDMATEGRSSSFIKLPCRFKRQVRT